MVSDFPLSISGDESKTVSGKIGAGGPKITLDAENGDIHIKRGDEAPPPPPVAGAISGRAAFEGSEGSAGAAGNAVKQGPGVGKRE